MSLTEEGKPDTIRILKYNFPVSLIRAHVIHANKFSEAHGGAFDLPVQSTLYTDVVFQTENSDHIRTRVINLDIPVYTQQKVISLTTGNAVLAFADLATNLFYYATNDPGGRLGVRMKLYLVWLIGITGGLILFGAFKDFSFWIFAPLIIMLVIYYLQKFIINSRIRSQIEQIMGG